MKPLNRWRLAPLAATVAALFPLLASAAPAYQMHVPAKTLKVQSATTVALDLSASTLSFGNQLVGTTSAVKSVVVTNTGTAPTTIGTPTVSGPFLASTDCSSTLNAGASCAVSATFTPTILGAAAGQLSFGTGAGAKTVALTGTGEGTTWAVQGSPSTSFGLTQVGVYATPDQAFTVRNTGNIAGALTLPAFGGASAGDFSASNNCSNVAPGADCTVTVRFKPLQAGTPRTGTLAIGGTTLTYTGSATAGGLDPYYANVSLLMHFEGANGATGSSAFVDQKGTVFTVRGTPKLSTADRAAGNSSLYMTQAENAASLLYASNSQALTFGTGDFTVEFFWKSTSDGYHQWPISSYTGSYGDFNVFRAYNGGGLNVYSSSGVTVGSNIALPFNSWQHVAISRVAGKTHIFFNGALVGTATDTNNYTSTNLNIGGLLAANGRNINGYLDELRVTKGVGRYVNAFTPPTGQFPDQ